MQKFPFNKSFLLYCVLKKMAYLPPHIRIFRQNVHMFLTFFIEICDNKESLLVASCRPFGINLEIFDIFTSVRQDFLEEFILFSCHVVFQYIRIDVGLTWKDKPPSDMLLKNEIQRNIHSSQLIGTYTKFDIR